MIKGSLGPNICYNALSLCWGSQPCILTDTYHGRASQHQIIHYLQVKGEDVYLFENVFNFWASAKKMAPERDN